MLAAHSPRLAESALATGRQPLAYLPHPPLGGSTLARVTAERELTATMLIQKSEVIQPHHSTLHLTRQKF
jgi:hypothetical protein